MEKSSNGNCIIVTMQDISTSTQTGDTQQRDAMQFDLTETLKDAQIKNFDENLLNKMHTASNVLETSKQFVN